MPNYTQSILAPILLFVFARPDHTKKTLGALAANALATESDLIVYSDAARNEKEAAAVNEVRGLLKSLNGFRSVTIVERESNYGLARNIIEGVTDVCNRYGRVIVLEDDLVTSPAFLTFMNAALDRYLENKSVWHVSGWNYPIERTGLDETFFVRVMNCWGWATWADRWQCFEKNTEKLMAQFDRKAIWEFDLEDSGVFWSQVLSNNKKLINTWAIYWYATIFMHQGLCLNPAISYVDNIGLDGSGTHGCQDREKYLTSLNNNMTPHFPEAITESNVGIRRIIGFYRSLKPTLPRRVLGKVSSVLRKVGLR